MIDLPVGPDDDAAYRPATRRYGILRAIRERVAGLTDVIAYEVRTRRAVRELEQMDEQLLHDIGLNRDGLDYAVRYGRG